MNTLQDELENFNWDNLYQYYDPNEPIIFLFLNIMKFTIYVFLSP